MFVYVYASEMCWIQGHNFALFLELFVLVLIFHQTFGKSIDAATNAQPN